MGALLRLLTLSGRETDRLTHVLVNDPYDTLPDFFFPAQPGGPIPSRLGAPVDPSDARIELADVPLVRSETSSSANWDAKRARSPASSRPAANASAMPPARISGSPSIRRGRN